MLVREYQIQDTVVLVEHMRQLQQHIADIDPTHQSKPAGEFSAEQYVENLLRRIASHRGKIFVADDNGTVAGMIAGIIKETEGEDLVDLYPSRNGRVVELFVDPRFRKQRIGSLLMEQMESYFRSMQCRVVELGCFATNTSAVTFYAKHGYQERNIDFCKHLSSPVQASV